MRSPLSLRFHHLLYILFCSIFEVLSFRLLEFCSTFEVLSLRLIKFEGSFEEHSISFAQDLKCFVLDCYFALKFDPL